LAATLAGLDRSELATLAAAAEILLRRLGGGPSTPPSAAVKSQPQEQPAPAAERGERAPVARPAAVR
jgi:hypothetical protein